MNAKLRIGYFADGIWSHEALNLFLNNKSLEVVFICSRFKNPDKYLLKKATQLDIDFLNDINIKNNLFIKKLHKYNCDLFVSMSFDQIFNLELLQIPKLGAINCHASKLPFYRGRNILNWVLINDEKEFGITVHYIDEGIDTGDIILQKTFPISDKDNYKSLLNLSYKECPTILYEAVLLILHNKVKRISQNSISLDGNYCKKRNKGDEFIKGNLTTRQLFNFVRGITLPGPCARSYIRSNLIKIINCEIEYKREFNNVGDGRIAYVNKKFFVIKTKDGYLRVTDWDCSIKPEIGDKVY